MNDCDFLQLTWEALNKLYCAASDAESQRHYVALLNEAHRRRLVALQAATPRIVFASLCVGEWLIGMQGREQRYRSKLRGLTPAMLALQYGAGQSVVRAQDMVRPGATWASNSTHNNIRRAADWVERVAGCPPLANMMRGIKVEGGIVRYTRRPADPVIV